MKRSTAVRRILRDAFHVDRAPVEVGFALRCTIGVAFPLLVSTLSGHAGWGIATAVGALSVGFASRQGVYRTRVAAMLLTAAGMALSTFAGAIAGFHPVAIAFVAAAWAFGYGLLASLGQSATIIGQNSVLALVIFSAYAFTPAEAAVQAALLFGGGVFQTVLLVGIWPLQRFRNERKALAAVYRSLADYARKLPSATLAPPDVQIFQKAQAVLSDPQPFGSRGERAFYWNLYSEAERIREQLGVLASRRIAAAATAEILDEVAAALEEGRSAISLPQAFSNIQAHAAVFGADRAMQDTVERLTGQLRAALHIMRNADDGKAHDPADIESAFSREAIVDAAMTLRANLRWDSAYFQHAVRLAVVLFIAITGERMLHLERGYWAPMTALLVLRPDFSTTFMRGVQRLGGTIAGAGLATAIAAIFHPAAGVSVTLVVIFALLGYLAIGLNYAVYTVTVTAYVVFLLSLVGMPSHSAVVDRILATLCGGVLGLVAYLIFPTWERSRVRPALAALIESQARYVTTVLAILAGHEPYDETALKREQYAVWLARTSAEASVDRMVSEPVRPRALESRIALGIMASLRRLGLAALGLRAHVPEHGGQMPELGPFMEQFHTALEEIVAALREGRRLRALPPLRATQLQLDPNLPVFAETDLAVDAVNTIADLLSK